jgi:hypothetical protein
LAFLVLSPWQRAALSADEPTAAMDPHPLASADTSIPRATLRGFNTNVAKALEAWGAGEPRDSILRSALRAFETFDFSQVPGQDGLPRQAEAAVVLKDILDRIDLPPDDSDSGR